MSAVINSMKFNVEAVHAPGKQLIVADTLSCNPLRECGESDPEHEIKAYVQGVISTIPTADKLDNIREATSQDVTLQTVARYTNEGWPVELTHIPHALHKFHAARAHLSEVEGLLLHDDRIVVPSSQQNNVLSQIHQGHQCLTKC